MAFSFFLRDDPALEGNRVVLRPPTHADYFEWAALRRESRRFLEPWEPLWAPDELDRGAWKQRIRRYREEQGRGTGASFLIFERQTSRLVGGISIGNIRHGVAQSGQIGYWMGERHAGKGYMTESVGVVANFAFGGLGLHRLEAACIPGNERSIGVLEKAGFTREGLLRSYLRIHGVWQDHYLYALIAGEHRADRKRDRTI